MLDLSNVLAGPCSARTLAEYGADVIKIDPPTTYLGPLRFCWFPIEVSQGKRSMVLDLKTEEGLGIFWDLLRTADVVVHNFRLGVAERLGIDYESVKRRKPDIIYLSFTAYNGPRPGPWAAWTSFDPAVQGATGIMRRYGGDGKPILHGWGSCIDYMAGYSAAYGLALALYKRRNGDGGDQVSASLAQAAQLVQAPFMVATDTHRPGGEPHGQRARGEHALARLYRARDGWLFVQGLPSDLARAAAIDELAGFPLGEARDGDRDRVRFLEAAIRRRPLAFWAVAFNQAGLGCHRVDSIEDIRREYLHEMTAGQPDAQLGRRALHLGDQDRRPRGRQSGGCGGARLRPLPQHGATAGPADAVHGQRQPRRPTRRRLPRDAHRRTAGRRRGQAALSPRLPARLTRRRLTAVLHRRR